MRLIQGIIVAINIERATHSTTNPSASESSKMLFPFYMSEWVPLVFPYVWLKAVVARCDPVADAARGGCLKQQRWPAPLPPCPLHLRGSHPVVHQEICTCIYGCGPERSMTVTRRRVARTS